MKKTSTPLVDEHLESIQGLQEAGTDEFFYTRLKARMLTRQEKQRATQGWSFPLKPVWVVGSLILLLAINGFMLSRQPKPLSTATRTSLQNFAESYDQTILSSY